MPVAAVCVVWTPANRGARAALEEGDGDKALVLQVIIKVRIHTPPDSHADADPDPPLLYTQTQAQTYIDLCSICVECNLLGDAQGSLAIIV